MPQSHAQLVWDIMYERKEFFIILQFAAACDIWTTCRKNKHTVCRKDSTSQATVIAHHFNCVLKTWNLFSVFNRIWYKFHFLYSYFGPAIAAFYLCHYGICENCGYLIASNRNRANWFSAKYELRVNHFQVIGSLFDYNIFKYAASHDDSKTWARVISR